MSKNKFEECDARALRDAFSRVVQPIAGQTRGFWATSVNREPLDEACEAVQREWVAEGIVALSAFTSGYMKLDVRETGDTFALVLKAKNASGDYLDDPRRVAYDNSRARTYESERNPYSWSASLENIPARDENRAACK